MRTSISPPTVSGDWSTRTTDAYSDDASRDPFSLLQDIDFNDRHAVRGAHGWIAEAPALRRFCERACDGRDPVGFRGALATLILSERAEERHPPPDAIGALATLLRDQGEERRPPLDAIPGNRADALATLADQLSPRGAAELLQSLDAHPAPNDFSEHLTPADRWALAGHVFLRQAETEAQTRAYTLVRTEVQTKAQTKAPITAQIRAQISPPPEGFERAGQAWRTAAIALQEARRYELAADTATQGADAHTRATRYALAAETHCDAGEFYAQAGLCERAAQAYTAAALACTLAKLPEDAAKNVWRKAAGMWEALAADCAGKEDWSAAADASSAAADAYVLAGQAGAAVPAYRLAADYYGGAAQPEQRARALLGSADADLRAGRHDARARTYREAAQAFAQAELPELAADAYMREVDVHMQRSGLSWNSETLSIEGDIGYPDPQAAPFERAALAYTRATDSELSTRAWQAVDALRRAGYAYLEARLPGRALDAFVNQSRVLQTLDATRLADAAAYEAEAASELAAGRHYPAMRALREAAERYVLERKLEAAAQTYGAAAQCHMNAGMHAWAAYAFTEAAQTYTQAAQAPAPTNNQMLAPTNNQAGAPANKVDEQNRLHALAGEAWEWVAYAWAQEGGRRSEGEDAVAMAKAAFERAGQPDRQVRDYWTVRRTLPRP